jgi:molecular chaperone DnaJ
MMQLSVFDACALLSVMPDASPCELRRAYRRLALKYHPDKNDGRQDASDMFARVRAAFELLISHATAAATDATAAATDVGRGCSTVGQEEAHDDDGSACDDAVQYVHVTPRELYNGGARQVKVGVREPCRSCHGTGATDFSDIIVCIACNGSGAHVYSSSPPVVFSPCPSCGGSGATFRTARRCAGCAGRGVGARTVHVCDVRIPPGVPDQHVVSVLGGAAAVVFCRPALPDDVALLPGGHVSVVMPLDLADVLCGFEKTLSAFDGAVELKLSVSGYVQPDRVLRMPGLGLAGGGRGRGDLEVRFRVVYPQEASETSGRMRSLRDVFCRAFRRSPVVVDAGDGAVELVQVKGP